MKKTGNHYEAEHSYYTKSASFLQGRDTAFNL